jgi:uncharacterized membrane protein (DUF485 family)
MSKKETLRQKAIRKALSVVQFAFNLIAILFLFALGLISYYLFINLFIGGFNVVPLLEMGAVLFGLFLFFEFFATKFEEDLQQLQPKEEAYLVSLRKNLKTSGWIFLASFSMFTGLYFLGQYLSLFPPIINASLEVEILKTIIQADGFLIGLSGVVFAQMFWAINHQQSTIQAELLRKPKRLQDEIQAHYVKELDKKRGELALRMSLVILFFIVSIALSLSGMARTEMTTSVPSSNITNPFMAMILGIGIFMLSIYTSKMSLEPV